MCWEKKLWQEWEEHHKKLGIDTQNFCEDGILNEEAYKRAPKKILFVMKETNEYKGGLKILLKDGPRYRAC